MVELTKEIIDVMKKIKDVIEESPFKLNRIEVGESGAEDEMVLIDIRRVKNG